MVGAEVSERCTALPDNARIPPYIQPPSGPTLHCECAPGKEHEAFVIRSVSSCQERRQRTRAAEVSRICLQPRTRAESPARRSLAMSAAEETCPGLTATLLPFACRLLESGKPSLPHARAARPPVDPRPHICLTSIALPMILYLQPTISIYPIVYLDKDLRGCLSGTACCTYVLRWSSPSHLPPSRSRRFALGRR